MDENIIPLMAIVTLFIGLPWLIFHYITKWKQAATITGADEKLLDDLYELARRLDALTNSSVLTRGFIRTPKQDACHEGPAP